MDWNKLTIPLSIVVAGGLIAGAVYFSNISVAKEAVKEPSQEQPSGDVSKTRTVSSSDHILGNPNAELVIVEYSDLECPYCKMFHPVMLQLFNEYGSSGKIAWVYRHFPIAQLHPKAQNEAEASECVNDLGGPTKFWQFIDKIYEITPANNGLDPAQLPKIAGDIGIDIKKFNECLVSGKESAKVQADYTNAIESGAQGTPYSVIISKDGTKTPFNGYIEYSKLKPIIDSLLAK